MTRVQIKCVEIVKIVFFFLYRKKYIRLFLFQMIYCEIFYTTESLRNYYNYKKRVFSHGMENFQSDTANQLPYNYTT